MLFGKKISERKPQFLVSTEMRNLDQRAGGSGRGLIEPRDKNDATEMQLGKIASYAASVQADFRSAEDSWG